MNYTPFKAWLAEQFNQNKGWDETTYNIVTAVGKVADNPAATYVGFHQGDKSRLASETTRVFLSTQIQCAECHDHKFVEMPQETFHHVAAFFVRVNAKLPWNDSSQIVVSSKPSGEHKMEGRKERNEADRVFGAGSRAWHAATCTGGRNWPNGSSAPENPWFAKAFVNRVWARMMGRGFCEPVDEIGELGDRVLPEIHAAVADHFIASQFDMKDVFRVVAISHSYQREIRDADKGHQKPFAAIPAGRLRGDEVFDSLEAAIELPNVTPPQSTASGAIRFPPPPKSTRDLVNEAFGFDPSAEQAQRHPHHAAGHAADEQQANPSPSRTPTPPAAPCLPSCSSQKKTTKPRSPSSTAKSWPASQRRKRFRSLRSTLSRLAIANRL